MQLVLITVILYSIHSNTFYRNVIHCIQRCVIGIRVLGWDVAYTTGPEFSKRPHLCGESDYTTHRGIFLKSYQINPISDCIR